MARHIRARDVDAVLADADAEQAELRRERDLAIAHDRQPYPTAWAYEQACKALETHRERADKAEAALAAVTAVHEKGEHNGLAICLHCASQMFPPPETGIWSESAWPCATLRALGVTDEAAAVPAAVEAGE